MSASSRFDVPFSAMHDAQAAPSAPTSAVAPLALHVRRAAGPVVGRQVELGAIRQELASARAGRLTALTLEGEPGIGKTRLLVAAAEARGGRRLHAAGGGGRRGDPGPVSPRPRDLRLTGRARERGQRSARAVRAGHRCHLGSRRSDARHALPGSEAPARVRSRRRRHPRAGRVPARSAVRRRSPVGRRGQRADAPLHRPHRLRPAHLPGARNARREAGRGLRSRDAHRRHGAHGHGAPPQARTVHAAGDDRVRAAGARREGQRLERGDDARAGGGCRLHRGRARPDVPGDGDDPGGRRRVDARPERRAPAPVGGAHADPAPGRPAARRDEAEPRRRRHPRPQLQPQGSPLDQGAARGGRGRVQPHGPRRVAGACRRWQACSRNTRQDRPRTTASPTTRSASSPPRCSPPSGGVRSTRRSSTC